MIHRFPQAACLIALIATSASVASAQGADAARAFELYDEAKVEFNEGRFENAIELLDAAYELQPEPILVYNLARSYEGLGNDAEALAYYEQYLEEAPEAENRGAVEGRITALRDSLASESASELEAEPDTGSPQQLTEAPPTPHFAGWAVMGAGVVVAASGLAAGALSGAARDDADNAESWLEAQNALDAAQRLATTANVLFITGGTIAVGGLVWALLARRKSRLDVAFGLDSIQVRGQF